MSKSPWLNTEKRKSIATLARRDGMHRWILLSPASAFLELECGSAWFAHVELIVWRFFAVHREGWSGSWPRLGVCNSRTWFWFSWSCLPPWIFLYLVLTVSISCMEVVSTTTTSSPTLKFNYWNNLNDSHIFVLEILDEFASWNANTALNGREPADASSNCTAILSKELNKHDAILFGKYSLPYSWKFH